ncbi:MAG: hypothetical protein AB7U38_14900 [Hyphomicrobiales bacterium]
MAATTFTTVPAAREKASGGNWLVRFFTSVAKGQEMRAQRLVSDHFRMMDTATLQSYGFTAQDIERLRRGETVPFPE